MMDERLTEAKADVEKIGMSEARPVLRDRDGHGFELRPIHCPTCGPAPQQRMGLRGGEHQRWGLGVETVIVSCRRCGLIFPNPFPFPLEPQKLYGDPEKYFAAHDIDEKIARYRSLVREIKQRSQSPAPRILDIGAGRGDLLQAARLEGLDDFMGLEFAEAMIAFAKERFGITLLDVSAQTLVERGTKPFDAIVLNAVLEHVYDPDALIAATSSLSHPGTVLYVDVPREPHLVTIVGNALNRARRNPAVYNLQPTWAPFHVFGFNPKALGILLEKHGFVIEELKVKAGAKVRSSGAVKDRVRSFAATQINHVANLTGLASNMSVWARRA